MSEIIYILTNEAMPGYIKIGKTSDLTTRVKDLSRATGVPLAFEVFYAAEVENMDFVEKQLHIAFGGTRVAENREFFTESPERVVAAIKLREVKDVTPSKQIFETEEDKVALTRAKRYTKRYDFERYQIPVGSVLGFTRNPEITCTLSNNSNVIFNGVEMSLSKAAQAALGVSYPVQGPIFWEFEDQTLDERRKEMDLI